MPDSIHVPILGQMNKGTAIAGIGALLAVGGYMIYKSEKKKKASAATAAQQQTGMTPYGYGAYGYGMSPYGYGGADLVNGYYGYGFGPSGLGAYTGAGFSPYGYGYYGAGVTGSPVAGQATTNAQWTEAAVTALTAQGYSGTDVLAALGQYLLGHSLTATQAQIVDSAIAAEGYPPTPPPSSSPTNQQTGQTGTTSASQPGYGQAGPPQGGMQAITTQQAQTLLSSKNIFNPAGGKSQRPFIWNGSAYVPATVVQSGYQYYAGPLEVTEITKKGGTV